MSWTDETVLMVNIYSRSCLCRIIEENNGAAPLTYKRLQAIANSLGPPKRPIPPPTLEDMEGRRLPLILDDDSYLSISLINSEAILPHKCSFIEIYLL